MTARGLLAAFLAGAFVAAMAALKAIAESMDP